MQSHALRAVGRLFCVLALLFALSPARAATFAVTYTDATGYGFYDSSVGAARRAAFEAVLSNWSQHLGASPVAINVTAQFKAQGGTATSATLAYASPVSLMRDFTSSDPRFKPGVYYASALANHLAGTDLDPNNPEITATFNSDIGSPSVIGGRSFYYGTDANPGSGIDFYSVTLHEIGHGLGFISLLNSAGSYSTSTYPAAYDVFLTQGSDAARVHLTTQTAGARASAEVSGNLFFDGPHTNAANGGAPAKLYAPATYASGSSVSHLDEATFSTPNLNELMTPIASGPIHDAGPVGLGVFYDMGWSIPPFVSSITRLDTSPTSATSVRFAVAFTAAVTGVDATDFVVTKTGTVAGTAVTSVTGSGANYVVTVANTGGSGTLRLDLVDDDSIKDANAVALGGAGTTDASGGNGSFATGQTYTLAPSGTLQSVIAVNSGNSRVVSVDAANGTQSVITSANPPLINSYGVARASDGTLYVSNFSAPSVVKISPSGIPSTLTTGANLLNQPLDIALGPDGQLYVANVGNSAIIKVDPTTGAQSTLASGGSLNSPQGLAFGSDGQLYVANTGASNVLKINPATGAQSIYASNNALYVAGATYYTAPWGIAFAPDGSLYVCDASPNLRLVKLAAGGASASAVTPLNSFADPEGLAYGSDGNLYVAGGGANSIFRVTTGGAISTLATGTNLSATTDVAIAASAAAPTPTPAPTATATPIPTATPTPAPTATPSGTIVGLVVVNSVNSNVVQVAASNGAQSLLASGLPLNNSYGVARAQDGTLYVTNVSPARVIKVTPSGAVTLTTGTNLLNGPRGVAIGPDGQLYVASNGNNAIIKVSPTTGAQSSLSSGGSLNQPYSLTFGSDGQLYVANTGGANVLKINPATGAQSIYASVAALQVGGKSSAPEGLSFGPDGSLYVDDLTNGRIVKVAVGGASATALTADSSLPQSGGLAYAPDGNLYLAGGAANTLTRISLAGAISTVTSGGSLNFPSDVAVIPAPAVATSGALVSQFRLGGPGGATDEFIELANTTGATLNISGWSLSAGGVSIPLYGIIPANGHFLLANSGAYSLETLAAGDATYTGDIPTNATLLLKNAAGTTVDTVGDLSATAAPTSATAQYAYIRRLESGAPSHTGTNATDFNLVDTAATNSTTDRTGVGTLTGARLGSPSPHNAASTVQRNAGIGNAALNIAGVYPIARYVSKNSPIDTAGRLTIRRTITNNTGATATKLRFRIVAITAGTSTTAGVSDLRALSSGGVKYFLNGTLTQAAIGIPLDSPTSPVEAPLTPTSSGNGGGLNAGWTVPLPNGGLAAGASINVEFLFGIKTEGKYRIVVDAEVLP